jgi:hypothetical protein
MVTNFTHERVVLPKSTAVGVAEEISEALVATITTETKPQGENTSQPPIEGKDDPAFRSYVEGKLKHLTAAERRVIEPVLLKYRRVLNDDTINDFKGTDLVKHRIITGETKPIRKAPYRTPYALRS